MWARDVTLSGAETGFYLASVFGGGVQRNPLVSLQLLREGARQDQTGKSKRRNGETAVQGMGGWWGREG